MSKHDEYEIDSDVVIKQESVKAKLKKPPLYAVIMLNDDYTPMEFVVMLLTEHFRHSYSNAENIMLDVHHNGKAIVGVYSKDIAQTKSNKANMLAKDAGHPLKTIIEPVSDN